MYINDYINARRFFANTWKIQLLVLTICTLGTVLYLEFLDDFIKISTTAVTVLGTALAFFIGFNNAQAYDRWWEARKIWGSIVNDSRSFARMVLSFYSSGREPNGPEDIRRLQERMIYRHIAWLYATKAHLRDHTETKYLAYLNPKERTAVSGLDHIPNGIQLLQGKALEEAEANGYIDAFRMLAINEVLNRFHDSIGKSERIKNTVFPTFYTMLNRIASWTFVAWLPIALAEYVGYWAIIYSFILGVVYELTFVAGGLIMTPFKDHPSGVSISAIVRTIEINLKEMLGEEYLPEPVQAIDGEYIM